MYTFNLGGGGGGGGTSPSKIISALNVGSDTDVIIPADYCIVNVIVEKIGNTGGIIQISMGSNNPDYDDILPKQNATDTSQAGSKKTILIDYTYPSSMTIRIVSPAWSNSYNFYFSCIKYR